MSTTIEAETTKYPSVSQIESQEINPEYIGAKFYNYIPKEIQNRKPRQISDPFKEISHMSTLLQ